MMTLLTFLASIVVEKLNYIVPSGYSVVLNDAPTWQVALAMVGMCALYWLIGNLLAYNKFKAVEY